MHNHPSGDPTPSAEDTAITQRLRQAGELLGISALDHVVIGDARYVSFAGSGTSSASMAPRDPRRARTCAHPTLTPYARAEARGLGVVVTLARSVERRRGSL